MITEALKLPLLRRIFCWIQYSVKKLAEEEETEDRLSDEEADARAEWVFREYANSILRCAYMYLHSKEEAEDILQETMIKYLDCSRRFNDSAHERAWLLRVAANLSKNRLAFGKRHPSDELDEQLSAERREDLSFVWDAVKQLPIKYREVIHLFYYEGFSTAQTAKILRKNESTVRSLLKRGREQLKTVLKEAYDFE